MLLRLAAWTSRAAARSDSLLLLLPPLAHCAVLANPVCLPACAGRVFDLLELPEELVVLVLD